MRRFALLMLVIALVSFNALLLDVSWWYGPFNRLYGWLSGWYHLALYFPSIIAPIALASHLLGYDRRRVAASTLAGLSIATWINDFLWRPILGQWDRWLAFCFRWSWESWSYLRIGFVPYVPWWLFSLSIVLRPIIAATLLLYVAHEPQNYLTRQRST